MTTSNGVVAQMQHAQGQHPAHRKAAMVVPSRDGSAGPHHYGPEAIGAMTLAGLLGIFVPVALALAIYKLLWPRKARRRVESPPLATPPYSVKAVVLSFTATAHEGNSGHDRLEVSATLNEDYHAHIRRCRECRETIVTDLHEFAEQLDRDFDARAI